MNTALVPAHMVPDICTVTMWAVKKIIIKENFFFFNSNHKKRNRTPLHFIYVTLYPFNQNSNTLFCWVLIERNKKWRFYHSLLPLCCCFSHLPTSKQLWLHQVWKSKCIIFVITYVPGSTLFNFLFIKKLDMSWFVIKQISKI